MARAKELAELGSVLTVNSGNVGIGTASPTNYGANYKTLDIKGTDQGSLVLGHGSTNVFIAYGAASESGLATLTNTPLVLKTNSLERLRIDSAGNVGVGTSNPSVKLDVSFTNIGSGIRCGDFTSTASSTVSYIESFGARNDGNQTFGGKYGAAYRRSDGTAITPGTAIGYYALGGQWGTDTSYQSAKALYPASIVGIAEGSFTSATAMPTAMAFCTGSTGAALNAVNTGYGTERMRITSGGSLLKGKTIDDVISENGFRLDLDGIAITSATTGINSYHVYSRSSSGYTFYVAANGGVYNFSGNNVNLSDERTKKNIEVAGSYLDKICAIPVKLFNYNEEAEGQQRTLGVIAQDVEAVAPEFVNNDGWVGTAPEDGVPLKTIYTTDMMFGMMKAIQELKAEVDALKATIQ